MWMALMITGNNGGGNGGDDGSDCGIDAGGDSGGNVNFIIWGCWSDSGQEDSFHNDEDMLLVIETVMLDGATTDTMLSIWEINQDHNRHICKTSKDNSLDRLAYAAVATNNIVGSLHSKSLILRLFVGRWFCSPITHGPC